MFRQLQERWHKRSLQDRFQRHCQHIFPFTDHLQAPELRYLESCCFGATPAQAGVVSPTLPWRGVYAHQITSHALDASYLSPRLAVAPDTAWREALDTMPLLRRTYLLATLDALGKAGVRWHFDGIGWRFATGEYWAHFVVEDINALPGRPWAGLRQLLADHDLPHEPQGVISLALREHRIVGHELLVAPRPEAAAVARGQRGQTRHALKVSSQDGMIEEVLSGGAFHRLDLRLNHLGRHMLKRYQRWGEEPAAFVFHRADVCTLFFA